jgi:GR25 family glycosyltransferase involved in LPS biosynthesis
MVQAQCHLLSGYFATLIQIFIGLFAAGSLVYKRLLDPVNSRRPFVIWLMDVSKQGVSSIVIHFSNIFLAMIYARMDKFQKTDVVGDECAFYFLGFVMDTLVGVYLIWLQLRLVRRAASYFNIYSLVDQGYYGNPPRGSWYFSQLACFLAVCLMAKFTIGLFMLLFATPVSTIGNFIFRPFAHHPDFELMVVMIICPTFLSIIQVNPAFDKYSCAAMKS